MKNLIIGNHGTVGKLLTQLLTQQHIPFFSPSSKNITDQLHAAKEATTIILATPSHVSLELAPQLRKANPKAVIIDCSTAFRTHPGWNYGLVDWTFNPKALNISNPGCFATAIALSTLPFVHLLMKQGNTLHATCIAGYSVSAKPPEERTTLEAVQLNTTHKHVPELQKLLKIPCSLHTFIGTWERGILTQVNLPIPSSEAGDTLQKTYSNNPFITLKHEGTLSIEENINTCNTTINVSGHLTTTLTTSMDNLMQGAAGNVLRILQLLSSNQNLSLD